VPCSSRVKPVRPFGIPATPTAPPPSRGRKEAGRDGARPSTDKNNEFPTKTFASDLPGNAKGRIGERAAENQGVAVVKERRRAVSEADVCTTSGQGSRCPISGERGGKPNAGPPRRGGPSGPLKRAGRERRAYYVLSAPEHPSRTGYSLGHSTNTDATKRVPPQTKTMDSRLKRSGMPSTGRNEMLWIAAAPGTSLDKLGTSASQ